MTDQLERYRWAGQQTNWDPHKAYDELVQKGYAAKQSAEQAQGGLAREAAGGALIDLAVSAIARNAGKGAAIGAASGGLSGGMRSRQQVVQAQAQQKAALDTSNKALEKWDRNYVACMQARKYVMV